METNLQNYISLLSNLIDKSESEQKIVANIKNELSKLGFEIPDGIEILVHKNDQKYFYLVLSANQNQALTSESLDMIASAKGGKCTSTAGSAGSASTVSSVPTCLSSASTAGSLGSAGTAN